MQDMIFAGGEGESPRRYAEVEVVLSSDQPATAPAGAEQPAGFSEIAIRRRLDRNGEGEYRLNGARCRLVDVIETLADANLGREMHSVISQGRVDEIVHSQAARPPLAGRGGRRPGQAPQAAPARPAEARAHPGEPRSGPRRGARGAQPTAAAEAPGAGRRHPRSPRARGRRSCAPDFWPRSSAPTASELERRRAASRPGHASARQAVEAELAEVNRRRSEIEERLAERDRERTTVWGRLTALRAAHERLSVRAEALASRRARAGGGGRAASAQRWARSPTRPASTMRADERRPGGRGARARSGSALGEATEALERARAAGADRGRAAEVGPGARGRRARGRRRPARRGAARRAPPGLARGSDRAPRPGSRDASTRCSTRPPRRATPSGSAPARWRPRCSSGGDEDDVPSQLRACSRDEAELQAKLLACGDSVTEAEVRAAQLRDRRDEARRRARADRRAARPGARAGRRSRWAPRSARRSSASSSASPAAARRSGRSTRSPSASTRRPSSTSSELEEQREDLESALAELDGPDPRHRPQDPRPPSRRRFEATQRNFEELIEHLFPGGRGRLRLVKESGPAARARRRRAEGEDAEGGHPEADAATGQRSIRRAVIPSTRRVLRSR